MLFLRKKSELLPTLPKIHQPIAVEREGIAENLPINEFEKITGAAFIPYLDFDSLRVLLDISRRNKKLHKKRELPFEQLWLGSYFRREILTAPIPDIVIRYIDPVLGWGVFTARDFKKMEYISEYSGKLRRRCRADRKNAYCFEYVSAPGFTTPYTIDARDQGGVGRYINHSFHPNLMSTLATIDHISHVILVTNQAIPKGSQLSFDYGPDYWACRTAPQKVEGSASIRNDDPANEIDKNERNDASNKA